MKIGVILGSIRDSRAGEGVARWVTDTANEIGGAQFELLDLKSFDLPFVTDATPPAAAGKKYSDERITAWSTTVDSCDGFIFVTPEYNHSVPGAMKNAFDALYPEWMDKKVGFVSYGAAGGTRAVEAWRLVVANANMHGVRLQVALNLFEEFGEDGFTPNERRREELEGMLGQLLA